MNIKIHPHNECSICSKPREYKRKVLDKMDLDELRQEIAGGDDCCEPDDFGEAEAYHRALDLLRDCQTLLDFLADLDIRKRISPSTQKQMHILAEEIQEFFDGEDAVEGE